jgi:phenylacetate-coenzyme A ligase PaaK-like adenylate-forming protein
LVEDPALISKPDPMMNPVPITPLDRWIAGKIGHSAGLTRADLAAYQLEKLNETLDWARRRSRFYAQRLAGLPLRLESLADLARLPFTTSEELRAQGQSLVCVSQDDIQRVVTLQTSGTTGEPKRVFYTAEDQELTVDFFDVGMTTLTRPGERVMILLPCDRPGGVGDLLRLGLLRQGRVPIPYGPVRDPWAALAEMQAQQADCLVGSPTQVLGLARRTLQEHRTLQEQRWPQERRSGRPPRTVLLSTDDAPRAIIEALEHAWGCAVYDHYGTTEMGLGGGVDCAARRGYHLREADLYFEIIDPQRGAPVPDGEYGEVVFTTLTRRGMPLIRYRTGDRSRFLPGDCPCGAALRTLEHISGRLTNFIPVGDGVLRLSVLDEALFAIPGLLNFSATLRGTRQEPSLEIEARALTDRCVSEQIEAALAALPEVRDLPRVIHCQTDSGEPGSLTKRILLDERGNYA